MRADRNNENAQTVNDIINKLDENIIKHRRSEDENNSDWQESEADECWQIPEIVLLY